MKHVKKFEASIGDSIDSLKVIEDISDIIANLSYQFSDIEGYMDDLEMKMKYLSVDSGLKTEAYDQIGDGLSEIEGRLENCLSRIREIYHMGSAVR